MLVARHDDDDDDESPDEGLLKPKRFNVDFPLL